MSTGQLIFHDADAEFNNIEVRNQTFLGTTSTPKGSYLPHFGTADLVEIAAEARSSGLKIIDVLVLDSRGRKLDPELVEKIESKVCQALNSGDDSASFEALERTPQGAQIASLTVRTADKSQAEITRGGFVKYSNKGALDAILSGITRYLRENG